ncbi:MAG: haloacid dehalogenase [Candidatus Thorarchaeota archaeon]|nr:haloacid dehalogenase [Candidatus Thorarchaeota archaeon]
MGLGEILEEVRKEIETDDAIREAVLPRAREAVRKCGSSIKESHRGNFERAEQLLKEAHSIISEAITQLEGSDYLSKSRVFDTAYQELAEAANVLSLLRDGKFTEPQIYAIPSRSYLTGLADTIGELRRAILNRIRSDDLDSAENLLTYMEDIFDELHGFDFPNALIPDLRRKCDVGRGLIERTRGDLTMALHQTKLAKQLQRFDERLTE